LRPQRRVERRSDHFDLRFMADISRLAIVVRTRFAPLVIGAGFVAARLVAQCPDGTPPPCRSGGAAATRLADSTSVIVLYLQNVSRDTAQEAIADALTDESTGRT